MNKYLPLTPFFLSAACSGYPDMDQEPEYIYETEYVEVYVPSEPEIIEYEIEKIVEVEKIVQVVIETEVEKIVEVEVKAPPDNLKFFYDIVRKYLQTPNLNQTPFKTVYVYPDGELQIAIETFGGNNPIRVEAVFITPPQYNTIKRFCPEIRAWYIDKRSEYSLNQVGCGVILHPYVEPTE